MMSSSGNRAASTMACNLSAAADSVNRAGNSAAGFGGFGSVVGGRERLGFEQGQQIGVALQGQAHRLESLNAFVACCHPSHVGAAVFAICDDCGTVTEFDEPTAVERLSAWAKKAKFAVGQMTLEIRGRCRDCSARPARAQA